MAHRIHRLSSDGLKWLNAWISPRPGLILFIGCLPVIATFRDTVADMAAVNGESMYPFLNDNKDQSMKRDWFLNWKWEATKNLERGMVVTFRSPQNPRGWAVKRIIGLEGDVVRTKKPYPFAEEKVPQGHIWVEGDGEKTLDSNTYGPISKSLLVGKAVYMLLPLRKFGPIQPGPVEGRLVKRGGD